MNKIGKCRFCGREFVKKNNSHRCCSRDCRIKAWNQDTKKLQEEQPKERKVTKVKVSMEQMLDAMSRLSEQKGRNVQYGEVQRLLITGKLKVKGGVIYV